LFVTVFFFLGWPDAQTCTCCLFLFVCLFVHFFLYLAGWVRWSVLVVCLCIHVFLYLAGCTCDLYLLFVCLYMFFYLPGCTCRLYVSFFFVCLSVHGFCCWLAGPVGYTCCLFVLSCLFLGDMYIVFFFLDMVACTCTRCW
jgi:hypothetical protein